MGEKAVHGLGLGLYSSTVSTVVEGWEAIGGSLGMRFWIVWRHAECTTGGNYSVGKMVWNADHG